MALWCQESRKHDTGLADLWQGRNGIVTMRNWIRNCPLRGPWK
jgi:hypothetical protein